MIRRVGHDMRLVGLVCAALAGCERHADSGAPPRVVVYTSVDRVFSEPILQAMAKEIGIEAVGVYDTEETKSTGLVNRLIAKRDNPDGDIFWSGDPVRAVLLKQKGITATYDSPVASSIPEAVKDPDRHWIGFSARTRVLLVNTNLVEAGDEPNSILELTQPKWKGRVAIANPLFGTTSFHVAALFEALGKARARKWLDDLKRNDVLILASNGEVKRRVASGEVAVGLSDSDDAATAIADGQPIRAVLLDQHAGPGGAIGTLIIPNTVSLIRGGPNPQAAKNAIDFLLSTKVQRMLATSCAQAPLCPGVAVPDNTMSLDDIIPMKVDYAACAARLERIMPVLKAWVDRK